MLKKSKEKAGRHWRMVTLPTCKWNITPCDPEGCRTIIDPFPLPFFLFNLIMEWHLFHHTLGKRWGIWTGWQSVLLLTQTFIITLTPILSVHILYIPNMFWKTQWMSEWLASVWVITVLHLWVYIIPKGSSKDQIMWFYLQPWLPFHFRATLLPWSRIWGCLCLFFVCLFSPNTMRKDLTRFVQFPFKLLSPDRVGCFALVCVRVCLRNSMSSCRVTVSPLNIGLV